MRGRFVFVALYASAIAGLLAVSAEAQAKPPVKIYRGSELAKAEPDPIPPVPRVDPIQTQLAERWSLRSSGMEPANYEPSNYEQANYEDSTLDWTGEDAQAGTGVGCGGSGCDCGNCEGGGCEGGDCDCEGCGQQGCGAYCTPYGLAAGVEATYLKPIYDGANGFAPAANYSMEAAPRVWLQWQTRGPWGIRGRFWNYDAQNQSVAAGDFGDTVSLRSFDDDLDLYAVDLELTRNFMVRKVDCCVSFGARNGRLHRRQLLHLSNFDLAGGGGDDATAITQQIDRGLDGTGITMAIGMRRPLWESRFSAVCNLRGSVLWGASEVNVTGTLAEVVPVGAGDLDLNDFQTLNIYGSNNASMWIGELQAGGEWNTPIADTYGGGDAVLRIMFEGQWWNLPGITTAESEIDSNNELYKFVGVTAAVCFMR